MKKSMWLYRSNLRGLEYYHEYKTLEEFRKKCHDFYLLQGLWFLDNDYIDEFVVWRLEPKGGSNHVQSWAFKVNGKQKMFRQLFVKTFEDGIFTSPSIKPIVTFFRGGFKEYCKLTNKVVNTFGVKLYCGTSSRITPQYGGKYDKVLVEDTAELDPINEAFYKTASSKIFHPDTTPTHDKQYDIIWPCNFTQLRYKGQEYFIKEISKSKYLQSLNILHTGNKPEVGKQLCKKYNVNNIKFIGLVTRTELNDLLNQAKFGLVTSNRTDGCPRIVTEIMMSGTPLILRNKTRLLDYYKQKGVIVFEDKNIEVKIKVAMEHYNILRDNMLSTIYNELSMDSVCKLNWERWTKK